MPTRAAREAASPLLLSAAQTRYSLPERAFAETPALTPEFDSLRR